MIKNVKNVQNVTKIKKNVSRRNKKRYLFLVQFNSTPDAQERPSRQLGICHSD